MSKHAFAFYKKNLTSQIKYIHEGETFSYKDSQLWNRLTKIVRIKPQDLFILFDHEQSVTLQATQDLIQNKRIISGIITKKEINKKISPKITLLLPILKKDAFEYAIYVATQMGVQKIVPIITEKSQASLPAIFDRLQSIMISACEQSKNFIAPYLEEPIFLNNFLEANFLKNNCEKIWFNEDGSNIKELFEKIDTCKNKNEPDKNIFVIIGPEAGFSKKEETLLLKSNFSSYKLTPTILRSREAICVGLGIVRSIFNL